MSYEIQIKELLPSCKSHYCNPSRGDMTTLQQWICRMHTIHYFRARAILLCGTRVLTVHRKTQLWMLLNPLEHQLCLISEHYTYHNARQPSAPILQQIPAPHSSSPSFCSSMSNNFRFSMTRVNRNRWRIQCAASRENEQHVRSPPGGGVGVATWGQAPG